MAETLLDAVMDRLEAGLPVTVYVLDDVTPEDEDDCDE